MYDQGGDLGEFGKGSQAVHMVAVYKRDVMLQALGQ
jgi:hypothetical protein